MSEPTRGFFRPRRGGLHVSIVAAATLTWTDMPAAATEFLGNSARRVFADLTDMTSVRFFVLFTVAGAAGSVLRLQYTTDLSGAAGWTTIGADQAISGASGLYVTAAATLPAAIGAALLRVEGQVGNAAADPTFTQVGAMFS